MYLQQTVQSRLRSVIVQLGDARAPYSARKCGFDLEIPLGWTLEAYFLTSAVLLVSDWRCQKEGTDLSLIILLIGIVGFSLKVP